MPRLSLIWTHTRAREDDRTVDQMSDHADARLFSNTPLRVAERFARLFASGPRGRRVLPSEVCLSKPKGRKKTEYE